MKKRWIVILAAVILLFGSAAGAVWFFLFRQPQPEVIDEVRDGKQYSDGEDGEGAGGGSGEKEDTAVLNQNVHAYIGEDADAVNTAITSVEYVNDQLVVRFPQDTEADLAHLGAGEIFWLEGDSSTPFENTYIGKVVSNVTSGGETALTVESPMIDEVFDELYLNEEMQITAENINSISTVEGVEITPVEAVSADFLEPGEEDVSNENMIYTPDGNVTKLDMGRANLSLGGFEISLNVDLSKLLNILSNQEKKEEKNQTEEEKKIASASKECKLSGKLGLQDLKIFYEADYKKADYGMKELSLGVSGKQVAAADLTFSASGEVSGKTTEKKIANIVKIQGLKEKVFPIAYFDCTPGKVVKVSGFGTSVNDKIEQQYSVVPFSCGFMVYMDIYGNLSLQASMNFEYSHEFENKLVLVRNNQKVNSFEDNSSEPESKFSAEVTASADADIHLGTSAMLYFFNINVADVALMKFGGELEGHGTFTILNTDGEGNVGADASFYARLYLKIIDARANIKAQAKLWKISLSGGLSFEGTLLDLTLAQTGQKRDTHYDANTMTWQKVTAEDDGAVYYKGTNGKLLREYKNGLGRSVIYEGSFFSICGLDESYIYVLQSAEDELYDLRRINKDGTTSKVILEDVKYILMMDEEDFYYVPGFSENEIQKLNRSELNTEAFSRFEHSVEFMAEESGGYFVLTQEENAFSWLMGPDCTYYRISEDGVITATYEEELQPQECVKYWEDSYYCAFEIIGNGYLRETAQKGYWLSADTGTSVEVTGISGWKPLAVGIMTEQSGEDGMYNVMLHRASDGSEVQITTVHHSAAFFTFAQDNAGNWYFMDQTETDLELYRMDSSFGNKTLVDKVSLEDISCSMDECGMEIVNNRLFFYTMPEWSQSEVLYRYNLY